MNRPIALNLVRGVLGALDKTPRGIDRIDFGYRGYLLDHWPNDCFGVLPTPIGVRYFSRDLMRRGQERLAAYWKEEDGRHEDPAFTRLMGSFREPECGEMAQSKPASTFNFAGYWRVAKLLMGNGIQIGEPVAKLPRDAVYLDVGHYGLGSPLFLNWLDGRPDINPVFMLHDAIPLEFPDMVPADLVQSHAKVLEMTARHAKTVIVPTNEAGAAIKAELDRRGNHDISIRPVPLPIDRVFLAGADPYPELLAKPYFVICGAIEKRKNHGILIEAWADLATRLGDRVPYLIIAGTPGFGSADILRRIEAATPKGRLVVASGLSTPSIARLMAGARALLMPSFVEGFGLPPVEALSLGTPAILSNIAAHREAAGEFGIYLDPTDAIAWSRHIEGMIDNTEDYLSWKSRIARFRPYDWARYMAEISDILREIP